MKHLHTITIAVFSVFLLAGYASAADPNTAIKNPDLTKGESIPKGADHTWTLGATGARGWMFSDQLTTVDARQIAITEVAKGSPAAKVLKKGDVILGVAGKPFSYDPRTEFGKALTLAESTDGAGKLAITRWREGKTEETVVNLPVLGDYSATAPYDCRKSSRILELGCEALAKRMKTEEYAESQDPIPRSLNALALLASGDSKYQNLVKKEARWAADFVSDDMQTWYYGYIITFLAEYKLATGDDSVMSGLRRLTLEAAMGQSLVGSWGHRFARPDGRLFGYGMMNAPGVTLTLSLVLARDAGVKDPALDLAIERSAKLLRFYVGKGSIPYGDHAPWTETHDDNGKNGMAAVLFNLLDETSAAEYFSRMSLASHGAERDCGHTGNFWNMTWAMPGVAQAGPQATGAWMNEFGAWYFDLARGWDGSFRHQGAPQMKQDEDSTYDFDSTGPYLLAYAMPLKKICLTGKRPNKVPALDAAQAKQIVLDGRGWSNKDRNSAYDKLAEDELLKRLASWSPAVRERAALALSRKSDPPVPALVKLLEAENINHRIGACQALASLEEKAEPSVQALRSNLVAKDLWLRVKAAEALAAIGKPAMSTVPELLEMITKDPTAEDPRGMEQRFLCIAVFSTMLSDSIEGVDRKLLHKAISAGLKNQDGSARSSVGTVYRTLSTEEIKPLLPVINQAVVEPALSGEMFAEDIRIEGLQAMATHHVEEGIQACVLYARVQNPWASEERISQIMKILCSYGARAKPVVPDLKLLAKHFDKGEPDYPMELSLQKAKAVRDAITVIEASTELPDLIRMK